VPPFAAFPLPRRRCATALASDKAARHLAACRRLPRHILHRARGEASGFVSPAAAVPPAPTFTLTKLSRILPAVCAISFAHGFVGYAGAPFGFPHFVTRRRLPAVKRTASPAGRVPLQNRDRATCCIAHPFGGYAANPAASHFIPAPFRRSHTPKANPLCGIANQKPHPGQFAALNCTPPVRGKFAAMRRALT
jgi:hypothetical protein